MGTASLALRRAGSIELAGCVAGNSTAKKDHLDRAVRAPKKPVGPLTKPNYLASNQLNIKILQALLSKMLISHKEACDV